MYVKYTVPTSGPVSKETLGTQKKNPDECLCSWVVHMGRGVKIWCCSTKRYSFQVKLTKTSMDSGSMATRPGAMVFAQRNRLV